MFLFITWSGLFYLCNGIEMFMCRLYGGVVEIDHQFISIAVAVNTISSTLRFHNDKAHIDSIAG